MHISEETLDDLLMEVFQNLLESENQIDSSKGKNVEIIGAFLELRNPRARLSRTESKGTIFSCLGELFWYLAKSNDLSFIKYYINNYSENSDDGITVFGGYGPRLFSMGGEINQITNVINLLKSRPSSRRAVIQLFDASDITASHKDIPCTCTLQFFIRNSQLHMLTHMRSNDAFLGLPHDIFAFTMIQEIIANSLALRLGVYKHFIGSLHLYERNIDKVNKFINEGFQSTIPMPVMPADDPWGSIAKVLDVENKIRMGLAFDFTALVLDEYWTDLLRLLQIFSICKRSKDLLEFDKVSKEISNQQYMVYINKKRERISSRAN